MKKFMMVQFQRKTEQVDNIQKQQPTSHEEPKRESKQEQPTEIPLGKKTKLYAQDMDFIFSETTETHVEPKKPSPVKQQPAPVQSKPIEHQVSSHEEIADHQIEEKVVIEEKPTPSHSSNESVIISNVSPIESVFYQIGSNTDVNTKNELNEIFATIKGSIPKVPEEGYIVDALKILVASKNGFVFLFDDDLSCRNLNLISNEKNFIQYITKKFKKIYKVIGVTKADAKRFADALRNNKNDNITYPDVNIDDLKAQFEEPTSARDIALEIFKDELE